MIRRPHRLPPTEHDIRCRAVEALTLRKRQHHRKLRRVAEGIAFCNDRDFPNRDDRLEAQRMLDADYLELFKQFDRDLAVIQRH